MWRIVTTVGGAIVLALALRDIFLDLFHPSSSGSLSKIIPRGISRLLRRRPRTLPLAGPLSLVTVIFCWVLLLDIGFALIYWGSFPEDFRFPAGPAPSGHPFPAVFYFSLEVLATLGLGDFVPKTDWLRFLVVFQALAGFGLVTASVSWIVLLYPALARMRLLARRTWILARACERSGVDAASEHAEWLLEDLALQLTRTRIDLIYFPIIYYFQAGNKESSLPHVLPHLVRFAETGAQAAHNERTRFAAAALRVALDELANALESFVQKGAGDPSAVFRAYAEAHAMPEG